MAMTKAEALKLTQDMMLAGVIETIIIEAPVLQRLPFTTVVGSAVTYNREATIATASFYDVGDTWTEATPTFTQVSVPLKIMGKDSDVDVFLQSTYANPNDLEAETIVSTSKAVAHLFSATFVTGDATANPKAFDGLNVLVPAGQTLSMGANGAALTLDKMDELIDLVKPGRPDILLMSKRSRRSLSKLRRASGNLLEVDRNDFGLRAMWYDGIELMIDENISDAQTQGSSSVASRIYALKLGDEGIGGLENGQIQVEPVGALETKDAHRHRIKWYATIALYKALGTSMLTGVLAA